MAVTSPSISLRPLEPGDKTFLRQVYASTRADELALVSWSGDEKETFLRQQFDALDRHYREHYDGASFDVIEVDGRPAGRLYVARWDDEIRIMDIALLPEHRGRGVGTALLRDLTAEADRTSKRLTIHVERGNRARRLYERLGFAEVADRGVYALLERPPRHTSTAPSDAAEERGITRATLLELGAGAALAMGASPARALAGTVSAAGERASATPRHLRFATYPPLVGDRFRVGRPSSGRFRLQLTKAARLAGRGEVFSLVFTGPLEPGIEQATYRIVHPMLRKFDLFIVPIGPRTGVAQQQYEAIVNRLDQGQVKTAS